MRVRPPAALAALLLAGCTAAAPPGPSAPADPQLAHGMYLVARNCVGCHNPNPTGPSPDRAAPPFRELAGRHTPQTLQLWMAGASAGGHHGMPQKVFTEPQSAAILAYIETLRPSRGRRPESLDIAPCIATAWC